MNKIKTFEEACSKLNIDPAKLPDVSMIPEKHAKAITAHYKLVIVAEALNEGWQPNWKDWNEYKYFPWFEVIKDESSASGFGLSVFDYAAAATGVGSRLCYKSRDLARYAGEQFKDLYSDYFLFLK